LDRELEDLLQNGFAEENFFASDVTSYIPERRTEPAHADSTLPPVCSVVGKLASSTRSRREARRSFAIDEGDNDKENKLQTPRYRKLLADEEDDARLTSQGATARAAFETYANRSNPASFSKNASRLEGRLKNLGALQRSLASPPRQDAARAF
jgi:hypothetical protein